MKHKLRNSVALEDSDDIAYEQADDLVIDDLKQNIEKAIDNLPEKCRAIFLLSRQSSLSYNEIAQELDISVKTVEAQMGIALKRIREWLIKYGVCLLFAVYDEFFLK